MSLNLVSRTLRLTSGHWLCVFLPPLFAAFWCQNVPTLLREELLRAGVPRSAHFSVPSHHSLIHWLFRSIAVVYGTVMVDVLALSIAVPVMVQFCQSFGATTAQIGSCFRHSSKLPSVLPGS